MTALSAGNSTPPAEPAFPRVVAHRGLSGVCPENTLPALAAAVALGADEIEFDLWASRDGHLVACHDAEVNRTSNGHGRIADLTWAEIRALDAGSWHRPEWAGVPFCRLEEILDQLGGRVVMNVHLKEAGPEGEVVRQVRQLAEARGVLESIYLAGDAEVLTWARQVAPEVPRCCLEGGGHGARMAHAALRYGCARVQFWSPAFTPADIARAHEHGLRCNLFFGDAPDTPQEAVRRCREGLDAVLTNWANLVLPAIRSLGCEQQEAKLV